MTDQTEPQEIEQPITQDLTDEQVDKFFENGGKESPNETPDIKQGSEEGNTEKTPPSPEIIDQNQAQLEEEKHARNYQAAMKEERLRRQELQRQLEETRAQQLRMEERFQKLFQIKEQESQPRPPSYDEDPLGHQQHKIQELQEYVIEQNRYLHAQQEAYRAQEAERQFVNSYGQHAAEFSKDNPDFKQAYDYLVAKKINEFMAGGLTYQEADYQLKMEEARLVSHAFRQGVNPAERVYAMAKASGYTKQADVTSPIPNQNDEVAKKLEQIQKSIAANKSLSQAGGKAEVKQSLSLQAIADMDDDEFDKVDWKKIIKAA